MNTLVEHGIDQVKTVLDDVPENCIFGILVRLPLETLICSSRFVSKSWYEIINSPNFINSHLRRSDTTARGLILLTSVEDYLVPPKTVFSVESNSMIFDLPWLIHIKFIEIKDLKSTIKAYNATFRGKIVATCNGLIVLEINPKTVLVILNPVTRELEEIPLGSISSLPQQDSYALAFCHESRRYKLLHLFMKDGSRNNLGCEIIEIGSGGTWRAVDVPPIESERRFDFLEKPVFAMGTLHWIQYVFYHGGDECIVSMPLDDEKFKTMAIPETCARYFHFKSVFAMGEFLGFASGIQRSKHHQIGVWILRGECGWEKQYDIDVASSGLGYKMNTSLLYIFLW